MTTYLLLGIDSKKKEILIIGIFGDIDSANSFKFNDSDYQTKVFEFFEVNKFREEFLIWLFESANIIGVEAKDTFNTFTTCLANFLEENESEILGNEKQIQ